jgi:hypothetical protein
LAIRKKKRKRVKRPRKKPRRTDKQSTLRVVAGDSDRIKNGKITANDRDPAGRFVKGNPGGGRRPGARNKTTMAVKQATLEALNYGKGAVHHLVRMRDSKTASDRSAFLHLCGKLIPRDVVIEGNVDLNDGQVPVVVLPANGRARKDNDEI